jgi:hypothetical protein
MIDVTHTGPALGHDSAASLSDGRFGSFVASEPDFVAVLSQERTGTTSISHSLKQAFGDGRVTQVHYLNADRYRGPTDNKDKQEAINDKRAREARVRAWLANPGLKGVVISVVRDPLSRIASALWIDKTDAILSHYDPSKRLFRPEVMAVFARRLNEALMKQANYAEDVYLPLGLPAQPSPGAYRAKGGTRVLVLDFRRLEEDFAEATTAAFGEPVPLLPARNGAERYGDLQAYADFRSVCAELIKSRGFRLPS